MVEFKKVTVRYTEQDWLHCVVDSEVVIEVFFNKFICTMHTLCAGETREIIIEQFISQFESMLTEHAWSTFSDRLPMRDKIRELAEWKKISNSKYDELWSKYI